MKTGKTKTKQGIETGNDGTYTARRVNVTGIRIDGSTAFTDPKTLGVNPEWTFAYPVAFEKGTFIECEVGVDIGNYSGYKRLLWID